MTREAYKELWSGFLHEVRRVLFKYGKGSDWVEWTDLLASYNQIIDEAENLESPIPPEYYPRKIL